MRAPYRNHPKHRQATGPWTSRLRAALTGDRARLVTLVSFIVLVAITGGGSRSDILSLLVLRPLSVFFAVYAGIVLATGQLRSVRGPLVIVLALMALCLVQLVPLPPGIWTSLPHREFVAEAGQLLGMGDIYRPISLDPDRTWNTFFSLFVPLTAILLVAVQAPRNLRLVVPLLIGLGLLSALVGILQSISGNAFHFYRIDHANFPVGLFANKNHQSILLLWTMVATCWLATRVDASRNLSARATIGGALAVVLVLFPLLVLTGSRAGLGLSPIALLLCGWLLLRAPAAADLRKKAGARAKVLFGAAAAVLFLPLVFVAVVLASSDRTTALSRLFAEEATDDLRWKYLSIFREMAADFMPLGSGMGSFEKTFNMFEPSLMLTSRYMNQAHNELMQILIEGGIAGALILLAAVGWLVWALVRSWRCSKTDGRSAAIFVGGSVLLWLAASLVDYPLRTPIAAMLLASLTAWLSTLGIVVRSSPGATPGAAIPKAG